MRDVNPRITLGHYGRLDNLNEICLGFQLANLVVFDIKNSVLVNLKIDQFARRDTANCNAHLTSSLDTCITINPSGISESDKRLKLFGYSLKGMLSRFSGVKSLIRLGPFNHWYLYFFWGRAKLRKTLRNSEFGGNFRYGKVLGTHNDYSTL